MGFKNFHDPNNDTYFDIIRNNIIELKPVHLYHTYIEKYALLLAHISFNEKQYETYKKLNNKKRAGYLFIYLIKCAKNLKINKILIDDLWKAHNKLSVYKEEYYKDNFKKQLIKDFSEKNFENIQKAYNSYMIDEKVHDEFENKFELLYKIILMSIKNNNIRKNKIEKIFDI